MAARQGISQLVAGLALLALLVGGASAARADQPDYELTLYLWGEDLHGEVDTPKGSADMHVAFSDLLDHLNVGAMARGRANFGDFSIVGDVEYTQVESDDVRRTIRLGPRGGLEFPVEASVELEQWIVELNGGYRVFDVRSFMAKSDTDPRRVFGELYAGGRYLSIKTEVDVRIGALSRDPGVTERWVDGVVGARVGMDLSRTVVMSLQGDAGGFGIGNSSDFAFLAMAALSWRISDATVLHAGYKVLDFRRDIGDSELDLQQRGPFLGTTFLF